MTETVAVHIPKVFYIFAGIAVFYFLYNARRAFAARIGRPTEKPLRIWEIVRNAVYYGIAQRKVTSRQFGYAAVMHFCLGWGFIELFFATTVDFLVERGLFVEFLPHKDTTWFAVLNEIGGLLLIVGIILALVRRHTRIKPVPLPQNSLDGRGNLFGDTGILIILLLLGVGGFLSEAARLVMERPPTAEASFIAYPLTFLVSAETWRAWQPWLWWTHAGLALVLIAVFPQTKLFHTLIGIANVALTRIPARGELRPMNIAALMESPDLDAEGLVLGAGKVEDFTWKQLLDAEACTECARCTSVCPAFNTDKPLSPMKIIQDLRRTLYGQTILGRASAGLIGECIAPLELWSCTTCRACMEVCPVFIDHIPTIIDMRRFLVLSEGQPPQDATGPLEKTGQQGNPWGFPRSNRIKWATDAGLDVPLMADKQTADVLYWVGCAGAYDPRNQEVSKAMVTIFQAAGADYAVLGEEENCTGDSARRMGEEYLYETLAQQNIATLAKYRFNRIVTACPHCFQALGFDYRQFGTTWEVTHHSVYIQELLDQGRLKLNGNRTGRTTYHDPCYLGRHHRIYQPPREVLRRVSGKQDGLVEMSQAGAQSFCCGAGGGNMWYDITEGKRINLERFDQALETGADTLATACSFCMIMLDDAVKVRGKEESIQIRDIAELAADGLTATTE